MSELDERVRRAFDDVVVPDDVKRATPVSYTHLTLPTKLEV